MIAVILATCLYPQLKPVPIQGGLRSAGLISLDGDYLYEDRGETRIDLATGNRWDGEDILVGLLRDHPYKPYARTTSQKLESIDPDNMYTREDRPEYMADALERDHLLVIRSATGPFYAPAQPQAQFVLVCEIRYAVRGADPNPMWVLALSPRSKSRPIAARYLGKKIEMWVDEEARGGHAFRRYLADRDHPERGFRPDREVSLAKYPRLLNEGILFNTWNPKQKTFLYSGTQGYYFATVTGKVAAEADDLEQPQLHNRNMQLIWKWVVPAKGVPQGKGAWWALARSTDNRYWLIENKSTHKVFRLHLPSNH